MTRSGDTHSTPSGWNEKDIFLRAIKLTGVDREAYVSSACPDAAARKRIEDLLQHHEQATDELLKVAIHAGHDRQGPLVRLDEFKIICRLGEGGMGIVYLAEDTILGRRVALKVLARHLVGSEAAIGRFRDEARSAAALKHPAIVSIYKFGQDSGDVYLVSEYVEGPTLAELISKRRYGEGPGSSQGTRQWHRSAAEIVATVADALEAAHRAGIVHRDVKPSNILMDRERGPRLTDFGIAKDLRSRPSTLTTGFIGSCHYISPEQASVSAARVDQRSDIFSLGVVLYELLSLRLPFDGATIQQILRSVSDCAPTRLRTIDRRIAKDLETICAKAIEKRPRDRYQSAAHLAADLRSFLAGDPILARPASRLRRFSRFARRRSGWIISGIAVLLAALTVGLLFEREKAEQSRRVTVEILCEDPSASIAIHHFPDGETAAQGKAGEMFHILPGRYRLRVRSPRRGGHAERTINALTPGSAYRIPISHVSREGTTNEMIFFKAGAYRIGTPGVQEGPSREREVQLRGFWLDRSEVSVGSYRRFLQETRRAAPFYGELSSAWDDLPVVGVTYDDATAYAAWCDKRLPTAEEWEAAARSPDGRLRPWGSNAGPPNPAAGLFEAFFLGGSAEARRQYEMHSRAVHLDVGDVTQNGLLNMYGNVMEITDTVDGYGNLVMKGAAWYHSPSWWDLSRIWTMPQRIDPNSPGPSINSGSFDRGFRCAKSEELE